MRSGTAHQKYKATCFDRAFSDITDMRRDKSPPDFSSDSSRLCLETINTSTVSLSKRVDIPVIVHTTSVSIVCLLRALSFQE